MLFGSEGLAWSAEGLVLDVWFSASHKKILMKGIAPVDATNLAG